MDKNYTLITKQELLMLAETIERMQKEQSWLLSMLQRLAERMQMDLDFEHETGIVDSRSDSSDVRKTSESMVGVEI